jgi:hypothetical protein
LPFGLCTFFQNEGKKKEPFEHPNKRQTVTVGQLKHSFFAEKAVLMA